MITAADGTVLGHRSVGQGPGLVLVHGSVESAASHSELASALADSFTVTVYDRRGRGSSGPFGSSHGLGTEVADLAAVLASTGAELVFGVSSGGLVALEAALSLPLRKVVVYEPALVSAGHDLSELDRYDARLASGDVVGAMVAAMKGGQMGPPVMNRLPDFVLRPLVRLGMDAESRKAAPGSFTMRLAAPTLAGDFRLVREAAGRASRYASISAPVLLLGGGQSPQYLKDGLRTLERVLPHARRVEFARLGHGGSGNVAQRGNPLTVAGEMRTFLA